MARYLPRSAAVGFDWRAYNNDQLHGEARLPPKVGQNYPLGSLYCAVTSAS